jgi:STE24 endopeptidase
MMTRTGWLVLLLGLLMAGCLAAQSSAPAFDVKAATDAYLAKVPAADKVRSDAYFEGGYWLILWDFLYSAVAYLFLLWTRASARMRNNAERWTKYSPLQTFLYWFQFSIVMAVLTFPITVYEGFFRERVYGLMNQSFGGWFLDQGKALLIGILFGGLIVVALFGIIRKLPRSWPVWGAIVSVVFVVFIALIGPVYLAPMFNDYKKLSDPKVRDPILSLARANGIPATEVYEVDASRQSKRISANVSGIFGTERITLNDNLLNRCTPEEIMAVMGHEMGHYVLNHVYKFIGYAIIIAAVLFACLRWALDWSLARWGERWGIRGIGDVAVLPLAALIFAVFFFLFTPIGNTMTRVEEYEADIFGLNAARQPDAEAEVALKLGEYRKLDPGPIEEFIFFDHPSGRTRIRSAMRWKAENTPKAP